MTSKRIGCGIGYMPEEASADVRWQGPRLAVCFLHSRASIQKRDASLRPLELQKLRHAIT